MERVKNIPADQMYPLKFTVMKHLFKEEGEKEKKEKEKAFKKL